MKAINQLSLFLILCMSLGMSAQNIINGVVTDKITGSPLPGVNVVIKVPPRELLRTLMENTKLRQSLVTILVFSYIGFASTEVSVQNSKIINVALEEDAQQLGEVVLIGYGTATKKDLTGSVDKVSTEDFNKGAITSPEQLLAAKTAGVRITSGSGQAGSGAQILIRAGSSLNASNNPLIVVDGVPLDVDKSGLNSINPNDIADFTILKDASATAIFGSRASNGVIMITTKKGQMDSPLQFELQTRIGYSQIDQQVEMLSASQFRDIN